MALQKIVNKYVRVLTVSVLGAIFVSCTTVAMQNNPALLAALLGNVQPNNQQGAGCDLFGGLGTAALFLNQNSDVDQRLRDMERNIDTIVQAMAGGAQNGQALPVRVNAPVNNRGLVQQLINTPTGHAISRGWNQAVYAISAQTFSELLKGIPDGMKKFTAFLGAYAYKLSFGSRGLTWNSLAKINNRIHALCLPLTGAPAGVRDRQRRGDLIGGAEQGVSLAENNWQMFQAVVLRELEHAQNYLKEALPCYDLMYLNAAPQGLKIKLARVVQACSLQDNKQVSFYSGQALDCLAKLIKLVQEFKSFDEAQQKYEQTKRWLSLTCNTFEQIALILDGENTQRPAGRLLFSKLSAQSPSAMPALDALLGGVLPSGAPAN